MLESLGQHFHTCGGQGSHPLRFGVGVRTLVDAVGSVLAHAPPKANAYQGPDFLLYLLSDRQPGSMEGKGQVAGATCDQHATI